MKKHIPNTVTLLNILCGSLSIAFALMFNDLILASGFILLASVLDLLDGLLARLLKAKSEMGKQLDSLADLVSFGIAPAMLLLAMIIDHGSMSNSNDPSFLLQPSALILLLPLFSAYRLAKFNTDESQQNEFRGMPTPASAIFIAAIPFIVQYGNLLNNTLQQTTILIVICLINCILMVTNIRFLSFKFKSFDWGSNYLMYSTILSGIVLYIIFGIDAIGFIYLVYILASIINTMKP